MRELVNEQRARVKKVLSIQVFPLIGHCPGRETLLRQGVGWRTQAQDVKENGFAIALPPVIEKATLRLPAMCNGRAMRLGPAPVNPAVEDVGKLSQFNFSWRISIEVGRCG